MNNVTIGIPLYNEEKYIADAIRSAAPQCSKLIVSDNCSSDNSESICRELCNEFSNVEYIKQPSNIGAVGNFKYLLDKATTDYFMWLGAHDRIPGNYVGNLVSSLEDDKEAVLAYGNSLHIDIHNQPIRLYEYHFAQELASKDKKNRLLAIIKNLNDCSMIHGVFVRKALKQSWSDFNYLGGDHVLLARMAIFGKMVLNPHTYLYRREIHENDNLQKQLKRIKGNQNANKAKRKQEMQIALNNLVKEQSAYEINLYRLKCHFYLSSRFGNFSDSYIVSSIEYLLWNTFRAMRLIKRLLNFKVRVLQH